MGKIKDYFAAISGTDNSEFSRIANATIILSLRAVAIGVGIVLILLSLLFPLYHLPGTNLTLIILNIVFALILFAIAALLIKVDKSSRYAQIIAFGIGMLIFINSCITLSITKELHFTTNFGLLIIGSGFFLFSVKWLAFADFIYILGWGIVAYPLRNHPDWYHYIQLQAEFLVISFLVNYSRIQTVHLQLSRIKESEKHQAAMAAAQKNLEASQASLQETLLRYQHLIESPGTSIFLMNENGRFKFSSPQASVLTEYTPEEIHRMFLVDLAWPDWRENVQKFYLNQFVEEIPETKLVFPILTKSGKTKWIEQVCILLKDSGTITGFQGIVRDITAQKVAEDKLKLHALVFENIYDSVVIINANGFIIDCNSATEEMFGYTKEEVVENRTALWHRPEENDELMRQIDVGMQVDGYWSGEINFVHKHGAEGVINVTVVPLIDEKGERVGSIGVGHDITELKKSEKALLNQKQLFENLVAVARTTMENLSISDTLQSILDISVSITNSEGGSLFLMNKDGLVTDGVFWGSVFDSEDSKSAATDVLTSGLVDRVWRTKQSMLIFDAEMDDRWMPLEREGFQVRSALAVPILKSQDVLGVITLLHSDKEFFKEMHLNLMEAATNQIVLALRNAHLFDTQRKYAERQTFLYETLRRIGKHLNPLSLAEVAAPMISEFSGWQVVNIWMQDTQSGELILQGTSAPDFQIGEKIDADETGIVAWVWENGMKYTNIKSQSKTISEGYSTENHIAVPIRLAGSVMGVLDLRFTDSDLFEESDLKTIDSLAEIISLALENAQLYSTVLAQMKDLHVAKEEAESANHIKSAFLMNISHELRTPLHALVSYSHFLRDSEIIQSDAQLSSDVESMIKASGHLTYLIEGVLDLAKIEAQEMDLRIEKIDIPVLIEVILTTQMPLIESKNNRITLNIHQDVVAIYGDRHLLEQMLFNLVNNAVKFTENGEITLSVFPDPTQPAEWVLFSILDTGIGMEQEVKDKIYDLFTQGDDSLTRVYGGIGAGLVLVKRISELLKGSISVSSEPGKGTEFVLRLPIIDK